jgi:hypothetical protein
VETNVVRAALSIEHWLKNQDERALALDRFCAAFGEQADSTSINSDFLAFGEADQQA